MSTKKRLLLPRIAFASLALAPLLLVSQCSQSPYFGHRSLHNKYTPKELWPENRNPYDPYKVDRVPASKVPDHHPLKGR